VADEANPATQDSTLGALLYADRTRHRIAESEWAGLVLAVAQRDQLALRALYDRAHRLVFTLALRITGNRETAEELTLDVFLGVWNRAASYDPRAGSVVAWIMNLARSRCIDRLRHEQRAKRIGPAGMLDPACASAPDSGSDLDLQAEARQLRVAVDGLPPLERRAVEAAYLRDMTYSEVALQSGEPLGTIKTRIRSALVRLRKALGPRDKP